MKKYLLIIVFIITVFCVCGCESNKENKYSESNSLDKVFRLYVDDETCVEYFVSDGMYNTGDVNPRYNQDGTLKINKECLKDLGGK